LSSDPSNKYDLLRSRVSNLGSLLVAFSGGVDSTLLAFTAHAVLGDRTLAVLAVSDTRPEFEIEYGRRIARELGLELLEVNTHELADPRFSSNPPDRCFHCKAEMFGMLRTVADMRGLEFVADGTNVDDLSMRRPGMRAANEYNVVSPLKDVGLHKSEIREIAHMLGLSNWDKPSMACLASRFPYGEPLTEEALQRVVRAETAIRDLGLSQFRVRSHGDLARLEVDPPEMDRAWELRESITLSLREAGYAYISQDMEGYRSGSLDEGRED